MDKNEIKVIIANIIPFSRLKEAQVNKLISLAQIKEYKNGELIYSEKGAPDYFYLLLEGRIMVSAKIKDIDQPIEILKRGTCFGIISLLTDDPHSVTARSIETSHLLQIEKNAFKKFLEGAPMLALDFSRILSQRVKSRSKPKKIFQSKKIAISGQSASGKTSYMFDLGYELKKQTKKQVICLEFSVQGKALDLDNFNETNLDQQIIKSEIDKLKVKLKNLKKIKSLLNFLSESYHFILYEFPEAIFEQDELSQTASEIHFLVFPKKDDLKQTAKLIKRLSAQNPLNEEKIKLISVDFSQGPTLSFTKKRKFLQNPIYATLPDKNNPDYSKCLRRVARQIGEVIVGLALGSGAAYGFSHIGVLKVLKKEDLPIDIVCGSSMGAVIGALWAAGFNIEDIERLASSAGRAIGSFSLTHFGFLFKGIMRSHRLEYIFKKIFKNLTFYDLKHTLKVVAFDFRKRQTVILEEGLIYKALAASCAFPGIFEPVLFRKKLLLDGGILNPLPVKVLLNYQADKIIASNITLSKEQAIAGYKRKSKLHIFDFIFGSIETMQARFVEQALKLSDVVIAPNLEGLDWMDFDKINEFIKRGEAATILKLGEIKNLLVS